VAQALLPVLLGFSGLCTGGFTPPVVAQALACVFGFALGFSPGAPHACPERSRRAGVACGLLGSVLVGAKGYAALSPSDSIRPVHL